MQRAGMVGRLMDAIKQAISTPNTCSLCLHTGNSVQANPDHKGTSVHGICINNQAGPPAALDASRMHLGMHCYAEAPDLCMGAICREW